MKTKFFSLLILTYSLSLNAQLESRREIKIPDIPGYLTLKCDFHMHTVFSDGLVWPTLRVDEAWREGLDVIAISDHIEYHPHEDDIPVNFGRTFEIAKPRAEMYGIIIIQAAEITRQMPPGHYNCLFLEDVAELDQPDFWEAINAAKNQGAFIMWNHPGWRQEDEIPIWYDDHTKLYEQGYMHGMEIVNGRSYYPLALEWCVEKNITIFGNTDVHSSIGMDYDLSLNDQRPITLVFATDRSKEAVKEALFDGRTVVYSGDMLIGKEEFLKPLFNRSVELVNTDLDISSGGTFNIQIQNKSEIPYYLVSTEQPEGLEYPEKITLYAERTVMMRLRISRGTASNVSGIRLPYTVKNLLTNRDTGLPVELVISTPAMK
ncbi:MAG: hypothetical protein AMS27_14950 [Bacteroides sp. SM23_62_1]|nr:MAG: hypothetical protein AMS27_14950 [Bacteroides sp. SM23_62_1]